MARKHAVVIGGSIAGLAAAQILAKHFDEVTVVERDVLRADEPFRRAVPQARHTHGLLASGREAFESIFPGITADLIARGALPGDPLQTVRWFVGGGLLRRGPSGTMGLLVSRSLLEQTLRAYVTASRRILVIDHSEVLGLLSSHYAQRVFGVRLSRRDGTVAEETLEADLVVDAGGRSARTPGWLTALGFEPPAEHRVDVGLVYTTRTYRREPQHLGGDYGAIIAAGPPTWRYGALLAQEGERWIMSIGGYCGDHPTTDPANFLEFARTLAIGDLAEVAAHAEPLSEPVQYRYQASVRRRYEELRRFPAGLVVVGDGIASFNPTYGQGMSVAALEALELDRALAAGDIDVAPRFFAAAARIVETAWSISANSDLQNPAVRGTRNRGVELVNAYVRQVQTAAHDDIALSRAFLDVMQLVKEPPSLMRPANMARVLASGATRLLVRRKASDAVDELGKVRPAQHDSRHVP